ncbi:hypothetical protein N656DRAFT_709691, partial [Canariomyces notabilis]
SYVWGSERSLQPISVNNREYSVGVNLSTALSHLRDPFIERFIWVDAICINQDDVAEKTRQVRSMAKIYAKASRVIVWLGEAAANSDQALEYIRMASNGDQVAAPSESNKQAIHALLIRPWFQRVWVRDSRLQCQNSSTTGRSTSTLGPTWR